ncbi:MAG: hypothetical protein HY261_01210 [Chloroflexi bacterium]|nr:hypothetical protein [Chloroflexota bacterium]
MATVTVGKHPEFDGMKAMELFRKKFDGKYRVGKAGILGRDFAVNKSGWTGVTVKVKQDAVGTTFVFTGYIPSILNRVLFGGLIASIFLRGSWKAMENEIATFVQNAPELK